MSVKVTLYRTMTADLGCGVANYSRELADYIIYVIDVSGGDKIPRKGGPGISQSDLLIVNKVRPIPFPTWDCLTDPPPPPDGPGAVRRCITRCDAARRREDAGRRTDDVHEYTEWGGGEGGEGGDLGGLAGERCGGTGEGEGEGWMRGGGGGGGSAGTLCGYRDWR